MNLTTKTDIQPSQTILILLILARQETHGYEIMQRLRTITRNRIKASPGTIYPLLEKLETQGYITHKEKKSGKKTKKIYSLTEKGILLLKLNSQQIKDTLINVIQLINDTIPKIEEKKIGNKELIKDFIQKEKEILTKIREQINKRIKEIQKELKEL